MNQKQGINWQTVLLFIIAMVITGVMWTGIGWLAHSRLASPVQMPDDLPSEMHALFVNNCVSLLDGTRADCSSYITNMWDLYKSDTLDCFSNYLDIAAYTEADLLQCVRDIP